MSGENHAVILVFSTSHAIRIGKLLTQRGITCKMIPVPRQLSSDCGVCVRINTPDGEIARRVIEEAAIEIQGCVDV